MNANLEPTRPKHESITDLLNGTEFPTLDTLLAGGGADPVARQSDSASDSTLEPEPPASRPEDPRPQRSAAAAQGTIPKKDKALPAAPQDDASDHADQPIQISLTKDVEARFREFVRRSGMSQPMAIFYAIETTYDRLPELLAARNVTITPPAASLFVKPAVVARKLDDAQPKGQFIIRIKKANKQLLANLVDQLQAPSRNALIETAVKAMLDQQDNQEE